MSTPQGTLVKPPVKPQVRPGIPLKTPPKLILPTPSLWGWAELHSHPASHMSFGADASGNGGIFWGKPGVGLAGANPMADMPPCATDSHYGFDEDPVRKETRRTVIKMLDSLTGWSHAPNGSPGFANWPNAQSLIHQQMHITSIKRAYDGGMRVMIASTTDAQLLSNLWTKIGFNLGGNSVPPVDPNFDYNSAKRQLDYINRMVAANPTWMRIVTTAAEARQAVKENKLAVILSLEFDSLTVDQILDLVRNYKVRHVIPIHLTDNSFGGTAVYSDVFNSSSNYLNGRFYQVRNDPLLEMRLGRPSVLGHGPVGAIVPQEVSDAVFATLGYTAGTGGHRNFRGLNASLLRRLMKAGLLIDVAHMSQESTANALTLAESVKFPMMDSHTGLRDASERALNERALMRGHARRLAALGGVMGLGTEGSSSDRELLNVKGNPVVRFTGDVHDWSRPLPTAGGRTGFVMSKLRVTFGTGGDNLRGGGDNLDIILTTRSGGRLTFRNVNGSGEWPNDSRKTIELPVPAGTRIGDLVSITLHTAFRGGFDGENWNMNEVRLFATEREVDTIGTWLNEFKDAIGIMGNGRVAIGTDINGFAPQVPFGAAPTTYPLTAAQRFGVKPAGYTPPALNRFTFGPGSKTYDFSRDGIAHVGMLADFIQALSQQPNATPPMESLFRSANAVVEMWEKAEKAAQAMP